MTHFRLPPQHSNWKLLPCERRTLVNFRRQVQLEYDTSDIYFVAPINTYLPIFIYNSRLNSQSQSKPQIVHIHLIIITIYNLCIFDSRRQSHLSAATIWWRKTRFIFINDSNRNRGRCTQTNFFFF